MKKKKEKTIISIYNIVRPDNTCVRKTVRRPKFPAYDTRKVCRQHWHYGNCIHNVRVHSVANPHGPPVSACGVRAFRRGGDVFGGIVVRRARGRIRVRQAHKDTPNTGRTQQEAFAHVGWGDTRALTRVRKTLARSRSFPPTHEWRERLCVFVCKWLYSGVPGWTMARTHARACVRFYPKRVENRKACVTAETSKTKESDFFFLFLIILHINTFIRCHRGSNSTAV